MKLLIQVEHKHINVDRFYTYIFGASNRTISHTTNAPDGFKHSLKMQRDNGRYWHSLGVYLSQPCESSACVGFAGVTIT